MALAWCRLLAPLFAGGNRVVKTAAKNWIVDPALPLERTDICGGAEGAWKSVAALVGRVAEKIGALVNGRAIVQQRVRQRRAAVVGKRAQMWARCYRVRGRRDIGRSNQVVASRDGLHR